MKIFILPTPVTLQPLKQPFAYPKHNKDYGVEQDFLIWLNKNKNLITDDAQIADWHYLPIFWTRYFLINNFGKASQLIDNLQNEIDKIILKDYKTFTICQYDDGPLVNLGKSLVFLSSRQNSKGLDIPLLCDKHNVILKSSKKYIACFNGNFNTHPIRKELKDKFKNDKRFKIASPEPQRFWKRWFYGPKFIENIKSSYLSLAPRGYGGSSFRLYESMQLGTVPVLIGDIDTRPFKKFINWNEISYYVSNVDDLEKLIDNLDKNEAILKSKKAFTFWKNELYYQKWCKYILMELQGNG